MSLDAVCIEVRKLLRCANVFLRFSKSLTETSCLKINVDEDMLRLQTEGANEILIPLLPYLTVEARTLSNLTVEECNASFRLTVANLKDLANLQKQQTTTSATKSSELQISNVDQEQQQHELCFYCANCECALLTTPKAFRRVREFPSGGIDMNEFFCHNGPNLEARLMPQHDDLFFGYQFVVLNTELLQSRIRQKESHIYCRRCLHYLGETLLNGSAVKLWADAMRLRNSNTNNSDLVTIFRYPSTNRQLMQKVLNDCIGVETATIPLLQQMEFSKVLLEASLPSRQRQYLLLHILEKQVPVLRHVQSMSTLPPTNDATLRLDMSPMLCVKVLYRLLPDNSNDILTDALLSQWRKDLSIHTLKISPTQLMTLLAELEKNSLLLPELYRFTRDNFLMSYIF